VDGYEPSTKTVFQYQGCHFHGCSAHCKQDNAPDLFQKNKQQEEKLKKKVYNLVVVWECVAPGYKDKTHEQKIVIYPHTIVYHFESYLDKAKIYSTTKKFHIRKRARANLSFRR